MGDLVDPQPDRRRRLAVLEGLELDRIVFFAGHEVQGHVDHLPAGAALAATEVARCHVVRVDVPGRIHHDVRTIAAGRPDR